MREKAFQYFFPCVCVFQVPVSAVGRSVSFIRGGIKCVPCSKYCASRGSSHLFRVAGRSFQRGKLSSYCVFEKQLSQSRKYSTVGTHGIRLLVLVTARSPSSTSACIHAVHTAADKVSSRNSIQFINRPCTLPEGNTVGTWFQQT